jgi:hypothetical protein
MKLTLIIAALAASSWSFAFTEVAAAKPLVCWSEAHPGWTETLCGTPAQRAASPRVTACGAEDGPTWTWSRCGDGRRGVVTMWGTPKTVDCRHLRDLIRQGDLDPHTPWLRGDYSCGRRHVR